MSSISDFAALQVVDSARPACYSMQVNVPFAHVIGSDGSPTRVFSETQIEVPLHAWKSPKDEAEAVIGVMARNAEEFGLNAPNYRALDRAFWVPLRQNLRAMIVHPTIRGMLFFPETTEIFYSERVPIDRVICLGPPGRSGTVLTREGRRGYILPAQDGVLSVRIGDVQT